MTKGPEMRTTDLEFGWDEDRTDENARTSEPWWKVESKKVKTVPGQKWISLVTVPLCNISISFGPEQTPESQVAFKFSFS